MESYTQQQSPSGGRNKGKGWLWIALGALPIVIIAIALVMWVRSDGGVSRQTQDNVQAEAITVSLTAQGPVPSTIKIKKGQVVTWENSEDAARRLTADPDILPGFDSTEALERGDTYTFAFETSGTFYYYDPQSPSEFKGTVIVE